MYVTITFRSFTPQPGGLEFRPGQDYYFISTSSQDDLHGRHGGRCLSHHMRIIFKVCCDPSKVAPSPRTVSSSSTTALTTTTTRRRIITMPTTTRSTSTVAWTKTTTVLKNNGELQPEKERQGKKTDKKDKHPNETGVKNEELVNASRSIKKRCEIMIAVTSVNDTKCLINIQYNLCGPDTVGAQNSVQSGQVSGRHRYFSMAGDWMGSAIVSGLDRCPVGTVSGPHRFGGFVGSEVDT
uniref:Ephrin RBD domain-containing protein n=1 Tax=Strigamia maritima TaxID=126957 RepID=T1JC50_STRMM